MFSFASDVEHSRSAVRTSANAIPSPDHVPVTRFQEFAPKKCTKSPTDSRVLLSFTDARTNYHISIRGLSPLKSVRRAASDGGPYRDRKV